MKIEYVFIFIQYTRSVGNLSKIGVHTSNEKWAKEKLGAKIGSCEPTSSNTFNRFDLSFLVEEI